MMKYLTHWLYATLFSLGLLTTSPSHAQDNSFDELSLNGLAPYVQLRKEYYIGALYLESLSRDPIVALHSEGKKRMDLRITIDSWSPRRFSQQWNQLILINNEQAALEQFADGILAFVDMVQGDLIQGDRITIDSHPKSGVTVYLNQQKMFTEAENGFFKILLNTWIGPRPPSSGFKNDMLSLATDQAGTDLLVRYENLSPAETRQKQIASWKKAATPTPIIAEESSRNRAIAPPGSDTTVTAKRQNNSSTTTVEKDIVVAKPSLAAPKPTIEIEQPALQQQPPPTSVTSATPATAAVTVATVENLPPKPAPKPDPVTKPEPTKPAAKEKTIEDEQQSLMAIYRSNILKLTYLNTQYPKRAMDFRQEGLVELVIKINRSGKLLDIAEKTSSEHRLLNKAAKVAVMKSEPFPEPPNDLLGDEIEIVLPFNFQL